MGDMNPVWCLYNDGSHRQKQKYFDLSSIKVLYLHAIVWMLPSFMFTSWLWLFAQKRISWQLNQVVIEFETIGRIWIFAPKPAGKQLIMYLSNLRRFKNACIWIFAPKTHCKILSRFPGSSMRKSSCHLSVPINNWQFQSCLFQLRNSVAYLQFMSYFRNALFLLLPKSTFSFVRSTAAAVIANNVDDIWDFWHFLYTFEGKGQG